MKIKFKWAAWITGGLTLAISSIPGWLSYLEIKPSVLTGKADWFYQNILTKNLPVPFLVILGIGILLIPAVLGFFKFKSQSLETKSAELQLSVDQIKELISIDIRSHAEQVSFYISEVSTVRIWLHIRNFSPFEIELDKVIWGFNSAYFCREEGATVHYKVATGKQNDSILVQATLTEAEANKFRQMHAKEELKKGALSLKVVFLAGNNRIEKSVSISEVHFTGAGNLERPTSLSEQERALLRSLTAQTAICLKTNEVQIVMSRKFSISTADFNILISKLEKTGLIQTATYSSVGEVQGFQSLKITPEGLQALDQRWR